MLSCFRCVQLSDPLGCSLPGSSVRGILQARIPEWIAMPFSRASSRPRNQTPISYPGVSMLEGRRSWLFQLKQRANLSFLSFCSIQSLNGLDDAYLQWQGQSSLCSQTIQMLISLRNTLTDASRNYVLPAIWASLSPVKLTHKINHHNLQLKHSYLNS